MALDRFRGHKASPDYTYISLAAILILFGLVMVSSSSVVLSFANYGRNYVYVVRQFVFLIIGLIAAVGVSRIDYRVWRRLATPFMGFSVFLLLLVFIPALSHSANGAARWINIGSFQLQPSEVAKLSFIIYLSAWLEKKGTELKSLSQGFIPFVLLMGGLAGLVILQKDMGTFSIIVLTSAVMFVVAGASLSQIGMGALLGVVMFALLIAVAPYRAQRLTVFLHPESDTLGAGYHINQSLLAIGSGGWWGRGFGKSIQKYLYLPEPHTDSIFAIIVEELGFVRSLIVLAIIALFAYRGYQIASRTGDNFGRMLAFGITTSLLFQSMVNIASILGLMPLTGLPLPFISYGGTSLIMSLVGVGIVVNISKHTYGN